MTKRMLVDATNQEEMRVVVADDERVREFEVETTGKEQLKGNIYVAEVVRVEPSLQAAFVSYGGNRNGFLAFSEIHPEWFNLPKQEKEDLIKELEEAAAKQRNQSLSDDENGEDENEARGKSEKDGKSAASDDKAEKVAEKPKKRRGRMSKAEKEASAKEVIEKEAKAAEEVTEKPKKRRGRPSKAEKEAAEKAAKAAEEALTAEEAAEDAKALAIANSIVFDDESAADVAAAPADEKDEKKGKRGGVRRLRRASRGRKKEETVEAHAEESETRERFVPVHRRYSIGDVLKEKQKIIVQVTKEERGTKGAALTTYISMPGRFTVLMPNTPYAGGISRKISDSEDRKELRKIYSEVTIPDAMGWIIRTAGVGQNKKAIKEDILNMIKQWKRISKEAAAKDVHLPSLLHEDGSLIVRAMRDMFTEDVEEVIISNSRVYHMAKDYVKSLIPERAKDVKEYKSKSPIFSHYGVESSLNHMHSMRVELESGGYLIINPTEALVSIDVNSGRATQESNIEETAFKTNLEAADEVARQLRLRDLAGLIVIDFIDMEDRRNERAVERAMRKAVHKDRARIQVGSISEFGLLEMSRQRLRPSFTESTTVRCPHCYGAGTLPSIQTAALMVLRNLEQENIHAKADRVIITVATDLAIYMLNHKKEYIRELESHYKFKIIIAADSSYIGPDHHLEMVRVQANGSERSQSKVVLMREKPETMDNRSRRRKRKNTKKQERENSRTTKADSKRSGKGRDDNPKRGRRRPDKDEENSPSEEKLEKVAKPEEEKEKKPTRGRRRSAKKVADSKDEKKEVEAKAEKPKKEEKAEKPVKKEPSLTVQMVGGDGDSRVEKVANKPATEKKQSWWNRTFS